MGVSGICFLYYWALPHALLFHVSVSGHFQHLSIWYVSVKPRLKSVLFSKLLVSIANIVGSRKKTLCVVVVGGSK